MKETITHSPISRRSFLGLLAIGGAAAAGGHLLDTYAPWLDEDRERQDTYRPFQKGTNMQSDIKEMVRYATLAASGHNTQPWLFTIQENRIQIRPDFQRRLPAVDPHDRELWISLGCTLENLLLAARASGYDAEVDYPGTGERIDVRLQTAQPQASPLFAAIPQRQNTRSLYDGRPLDTQALKQLQGLTLEPGIRLHFEDTRPGLETLLEFVNQGNLNQFAERAFMDELIAWLRFNKKEALSTRDGLYSPCSGNPQVPGWLGRLVVGGTKPQQQADSDAKKLRSSAGALLIVSENDDVDAWVRTGQVYERLALQMTALNIKSAFLNQPIEVEPLRPQLQSTLGLGTAHPQLLLRFGYAAAMPASLRRPVEDVLA